MTLFDQLKKVYTVSCKCTNCNHKFELKIPKGTTIENYLKSEASICESCGCSTLVKMNI
jgi:rRNA maturation endonuclease Nob1